MRRSENFLIGLIDGTGPYSGHQYDNDFLYSYLKQTHDKLPGRSIYVEGPGAAGQTTFEKAETVISGIKEYRRSYPNNDIFLAGYSRGGAAAIYAAQQLAIAWGGPVPISGLFLLDPVSKDTVCQGGMPGNVEECYVMYRDKPPAVPEYDAQLKTAAYESWIDKATVVALNNVDPDRYARQWMGRCDIERLALNRKTIYFKVDPVRGASHGAMGGLTWTDRKADEKAAILAAHTLNGWYQQNRIPARVVEMYCSDQTRRTALTDEQIVAKGKEETRVSNARSAKIAYRNAARRGW